MDAKVDISKTDGRMLADASRVSVQTQTKVFEQNDAPADAEIRKIILANSARAPQ
jgi:membrane fusion protein (multidrug efflux system)